MITRSIPPSHDYPGLIAHELGGGKEIVVLGFGEEAEAVLREAVEAVEARVGQREVESK